MSAQVLSDVLAAHMEGGTGSPSFNSWEPRDCGILAVRVTQEEGRVRKGQGRGSVRKGQGRGRQGQGGKGRGG